MEIILSKLQNHWLWQDKPFAKGQAWIDLLFMGANENIYYRGKLYNLPVGQLITSESILSKSWGWSRTKVRSFLQSLADNKMIIIEADNGKTIITIYQYTDTTSQNTIATQKNTLLNEQVETQANCTDNECNSQPEEQHKKQVKAQAENKKKDKIRTEEGPQIIQLSILDAIKKNNP